MACACVQALAEGQAARLTELSRQVMTLQVGPALPCRTLRGVSAAGPSHTAHHTLFMQALAL